MKVTDPKAAQVVPLVAQRTTAPLEKSESAGPREKVSVSGSPELDLAPLRQVAASNRSVRVQEVINAVKSGQYYPSPQQIANQLVSEAEIEARLRALLK